MKWLNDLALVIVFIFAVLSTTACSELTPEGKRVYGLVNGHKITGAELAKISSKSINEFTLLPSEEKKRIFDRAAGYKVLEIEAKKAGKNLAELLKLFREANPYKGTDKELELVQKTHKAYINELKSRALIKFQGA